MGQSELFFGELLVSKGLVPQNRIIECIQHQRQLAAEGRAASLADVVVEKGLVAAEVAAVLRREVEAIQLRCPICQTVQRPFAAADPPALRCEQCGGALEATHAVPVRRPGGTSRIVSGPARPGAAPAPAPTPTPKATPTPAPRPRPPARETATRQRPAPLPPPAAAPPPPASAPPTRSPDGFPVIPGYRFLREIGRGGMSIVYQGIQLSLGRKVAIKVLQPSLSGRDLFLQRFQREGGALARLQHPGIVTIYDSGAAGPDYYLAMEYVEGRTLEAYLREGRISLTDAIRIAADLCDALEFAHTKGVIHRDIKPGNILIDAQGKIKLADFGVAYLLQPQPGPIRAGRSAEPAGTTRYMAPEQMQAGTAVDGRSDIFCVGMILYEMLCGQIPMVSSEESFALPDTVDRALQDITVKALSFRPEGRFAGAGEMARALRGVLERHTRELPAETLKLPCPRCQALVPTTGIFCPLCGANFSCLVRPCPACKAENSLTAEFCEKCGAPLAQVEQRHGGRLGDIMQHSPEMVGRSATPTPLRGSSRPPGRVDLLPIPRGIGLPALAGAAVLGLVLFLGYQLLPTKQDPEALRLLGHADGLVAEGRFSEGLREYEQAEGLRTSDEVRQRVRDAKEAARRRNQDHQRLSQLKETIALLESRVKAEANPASSTSPAALLDSLRVSQDEIKARQEAAVALGPEGTQLLARLGALETQAREAQARAEKRLKEEEEARLAETRAEEGWKDLEAQVRGADTLEKVVAVAQAIGAQVEKRSGRDGRARDRGAELKAELGGRYREVLGGRRAVALAAVSAGDYAKAVAIVQAARLEGAAEAEPAWRALADEVEGAVSETAIKGARNQVTLGRVGAAADELRRARECVEAESGVVALNRALARMHLDVRKEFLNKLAGVENFCLNGRLGDALARARDLEQDAAWADFKPVLAEVKGVLEARIAQDRTLKVGPEVIAAWKDRASHVLPLLGEPARPAEAVECAECRGQGHALCASCSGTGQAPGQCPVCKGTGKAPCEACQSTGKRQCSRCGGLGRLDKILSTRIACKLCGGTGYFQGLSCKGCSGTGMQIQRQKVGEAVCPTCDGSGSVPCKACLRGETSCTRCSGKGEAPVDCPTCAGIGLRFCTPCKGRGWMKK